MKDLLALNMPPYSITYFPRLTLTIVSAMV